jgi:hypothetical protein
MRLRVGNPYREAHGRALHIIEWITPSWGVRPAALGEAAATIASVVPSVLGGLRFHARYPGDLVHGYLNTSLRPDGSLQIAASLYTEDCGLDCRLSHPARFVCAPRLLDSDIRKIVEAVGESAEYRLGGRHDREILRALAFQTTREKFELGVLDISPAALPGCEAHECYTDRPLCVAT